MLSVVHDADKVARLEVYNFQDIAACARRWADQLEAGEQGEVTRTILVMETPDGLMLAGWGDSYNGFELIGILEAAKLHAYDANVLGDE